jgi:hypothetical protein
MGAAITENFTLLVALVLFALYMKRENRNRAD